MTFSFARSTCFALVGCTIGLLAACKVSYTESADKYGAVALSVSTTKYGAVIDRASQEQASKDATASCGQPDCATNVFWFKNGCLGLAQGVRRMWVSRAAPTRETAEAFALAACAENNDTNCKTAATYCTTQ